jgi:hypothetical protein
MKHFFRILIFLCIIGGHTIANAQETIIEFVVFQPDELQVEINADGLNNGNYQLNAIVEGGTPDYTYNWTPATGLSNPNIANPVLSPGNTIIKYLVEVTDYKGCSVHAEYTYNPTGISVVDNDKPKIISMDNAHRLLKIYFPISESQATVFIYTMQGQLVDTYSFKNVSAMNTRQIATDVLSEGCYLVSLQTATYQQSEKIIIKK